MGQLETYFEEQLAAGYTYDQLLPLLLQQGYSEKEIQAAYNLVQTETYRKQLDQYVHEQIAQGAKPRLLEQQLIDQGYEAKLVHDVVYPHHSISHHHIISFLVLLLIGVGIAIAIMSFFPTEQAPVAEAPPTVAPPEPTTPAQTSSQLLVLPKTDSELFVEAKRRGITDTDCSALSEDTIQDFCWKEYSLQQEVPARCEQISNIEIKDSCYFAHLSEGVALDCSNFVLVKNIISCQQQVASS